MHRVDRTISSPIPVPPLSRRVVKKGIEIDVAGFDPAQAGEREACVARRRVVAGCR